MMSQRDPSPIPGGAVAAVVELLSFGRLMALGVNRPDGWPHVTTVGYVNEGLNLYFVIARESQKLANILADPRVCVAIRSEAERGDAVGVSMAGSAAEVTDSAEIDRLNQQVFNRFPGIRVYCPSGDSVAVMHFTPRIISPVSVVEGRSRAQVFTLA